MDGHTERNLTEGRELFYQQVAYLSEDRIEMLDLPIGKYTIVNELMPLQLDSSNLVKAVVKSE
jgi:hypothetical protein